MGARSEECQVASIQAGVSLTMESNLTYTHTGVQADIVLKQNTWMVSGGGGNCVQETTIVQVGTNSVEYNGGTGGWEGILLYTPTEVNTSLYPEFKVLLRSSGDSDFTLRLWDNAGKNAFRDMQFIRGSALDFTEVTVRTDEDYGDVWTIESGFDWDAIILIEIQENTGGNSWYVDYMYFTGRRWGGGSDNTTSDGFAEDSTSQTAYGTREYFEINDNFLSDAECEARAQALLALYKDAEVVIRVHSDTIDWSTTAPLPGNKTGVDMSPISVDADYRIDEMDIHVNMRDKTLGVDYVLSATPSRLADYLYRLQRKTKELSLTRSAKRRKR